MIVSTPRTGLPPAHSYLGLLELSSVLSLLVAGSELEAFASSSESLSMLMNLCKKKRPDESHTVVVKTTNDRVATPGGHRTK